MTSAIPPDIDPAFEVFRYVDGKYGWRLKNALGVTVAVCARGFTQKASVMRGIEQVRRHVPLATVRDLT